MCRGEPEHHLAVGGLHAEPFLRHIRRYPFAGKSYHKHVQCHHDGVGLHYHTHVHHHSHTYKKIRDEQSVAHKLDAAHQRRHVWHKPVQKQPGIERAKHRFKPDDLCKPRCQEHHCKHKHKLCDIVAIFPEKPTRQPWKQIKQNHAISAQLHQNPH